MYQVFSGRKFALFPPVRYFVLAAAALVLGACASDRDIISLAQAGDSPLQVTDSPASAGYAQLDDSGNLVAVPAPRDRVTPFGDYLIGLSAQRNFDLGTAAEHWRRVLIQDPDNLDLMVQTFRLMTAEGRQDEALRLAEKVIARRGDNAMARLVLAIGKVDRGDWQGAAAQLSLIDGKGLLPMVAPLEQAWILLGQGALAPAQAKLDTLPDDPALRQMKLVHRALIFDVAGEAAQAKTAYQEALTMMPSALRLVQLAGNFYARQGDKSAAREIYSAFLKNNPETLLLQSALTALDQDGPPPPLVADAKQGLANALFDLAGLLARERARRLALMHGRMALWLAPQQYAANVLIGEVLQQVKRPNEAIAAYRQIPASSDFFWTARLRIAEELEVLQQVDDAVAELTSLAEEQPDKFEPLYRLGNILRANERFAAAVEAYNGAEARLGALMPRYWSLYYFRGIALDRSDQWNLAETDFLRALELQPNQPFVMNYLAYSWVDKKRNLAKAEQMLIRAVELRPDDGYIVDSLGWVYFRLGRFEEAVERLEQAVSPRAEDPVINDHLGDAYWRTGRRREARVQWRRALSLEPEEEQVVLIKEKIKSGLAAVEKDI